MPDFLNMPNWLYYTISTLTYSIVVILAIFEPKLDTVLGIIGATAVTLITFYGPGGFYIGAVKLSGENVGTY